MKIDKSFKNSSMSYFIRNRSKKKRKKKVRGK